MKSTLMCCDETRRRGTANLLLAALLTFLSTLNVGAFAQTISIEQNQIFEAVPENWEADVKPPPPGEWEKNMPGQLVPRDMPNYSLRAFYLVPSNRTPMHDAVPRMQYWITTMQAFYAEQMDRYGFGPKTFSFETEADGVTPKIHVVNAPQTDAYYRADPWGRVAAAAQNAGLPVWADRQVWLGIFEGHLMLPDGSIEGIYNGGATRGAGDSGGFAVLGSNVLACATADLLTNNQPYDGQVVSDLGPYPMQLGVTGGTGEGDTFGKYASTWIGAVIHETGHAFGLSHDKRNDVNTLGNLMGNGFRGFRQWMFPDANYNSETRLSYGNALLLNTSRYFNIPSGYSDNTKPNVIAPSTMNVNLTGGHMPVTFTATDSGGLAMAQLILFGDVAAQIPLSGTNVTETFLTPYFESGTNAGLIWVFDESGNRQTIETAITVNASPGNRAPKPLLYIEGRSIRQTDEAVTFNAGYSTDPDFETPLLGFKFDLHDDGTFEPGNSVVKYRTTETYQEPGVFLSRVQITDPAGNVSVSEPIAIKVALDDTAVEDWALY